MTDLVHILSLNAQGLRDFNKRARLIQYLNWDFNKRTRLIKYLDCQNVDILFLQETRFTTDLLNILVEFSNWPIYNSYVQETRFTTDLLNILVEFSNWPIYNSYGTSDSRGCSIFINKLKYLEITDTYLCPDGR